MQEGSTPRRQVMDYKLIQGSLDWWQTDEIFFRDYYEAMAEGKPIEAILARPEVRDSDKRFAQDPSTQEGVFTETRFFEEGRNVFLVKHQSQNSRVNGLMIVILFFSLIVF